MSKFGIEEVMLVAAVIGILASIIVPAFGRQSRIEAREADAIRAIRNIQAAQDVYAGSCGHGGYAATLFDLWKPTIAGGQTIIPDELMEGQKSGYSFEMREDGNKVTERDMTCNQTIWPTTTKFFIIAAPLKVGVTGNRFFAGDQTGLIVEKETIMFSMSDGTPITTE